MSSAAMTVCRPAQAAGVSVDKERGLDEGIDYFTKAGQQLVKDMATLDRIEQQHERAFDVPGIGGLSE